LKSVPRSWKWETAIGTPGAPPQLSPTAEQQARIDERQKYLDALDAGFDLSKARLDLLRALGPHAGLAQRAAYQVIVVGYPRNPSKVQLGASYFEMHADSTRVMGESDAVLRCTFSPINVFLGNASKKQSEW
jgi:hypothetical protein